MTRIVNGVELTSGEYYLWEDYIIMRSDIGRTWVVSRLEIGPATDTGKLTMTLIGVDDWYELPDALQGARADKYTRGLVKA